MAEQKTRPLGVTIMVILQVIGAVLTLLFGLILTGVAEIGQFRIIVEVILVGVGAVLVTIGAINLLLSWGLWSGKGWAWIWTLIFNILSVIFGFFTVIRGHFWNVISLLLHVFVIFYLNTPRVKGFFGKT